MTGDCWPSNWRAKQSYFPTHFRVDSIDTQNTRLTLCIARAKRESEPLIRLALNWRQHLHMRVTLILFPRRRDAKQSSAAAKNNVCRSFAQRALISRLRKIGKTRASSSWTHPDYTGRDTLLVIVTCGLLVFVSFSYFACVFIFIFEQGATDRRVRSTGRYRQSPHVAHWCWELWAHFTSSVNKPDMCSSVRLLHWTYMD